MNKNLHLQANQPQINAADHLTEARRVFSVEIAELQALSNRLDHHFTTAVDMLHACLRRGSKVVCLGVGKSGNIAEKIAATLTSTGCPTVVLNSLNAVHGDIGVVSDGDVIIILSYSGQTEELLRVLPPLRSFEVEILAFTGNLDSPLARNSDLALDTSVATEACPLGLAPTSSTTAMLVLGDALAMSLLCARGFKREDFARFHPGGSLGRALLTLVRDIMRPIHQIAAVPEQTPVGEVLQEMTAKRCGAAVITDADGRMVGIFSHGDFVRHYLRDPDLRNKPVADFMTRNPISIKDDAVAAAVVSTLKEHKIDDLIVIDEEGFPQGLVDSQDLARLQLL